MTLTMSVLNIILYTNIFILPIIHTVNCVIHGRYTRDIKEYELSVPRKISSSGEHVSFQIKEYYQHDFKRRKRRDAEHDTIYYNVVYNGAGYDIELWPNHGVFSPNLVIEKYEGPDTPVANRKIKRMDRKQCHYIGRVIGDKTSRVALSVCDGLVGYFITNGERYFIEPLANTQANANGEHIHVVYKRDLISHKRKSCHSGQNWEKDWAERFRRQSEEKRKTPKTLESVHRYLETLVVADKKFLNFHKNTDQEKYIMTVMNMVSDYYHDATVGNQMDVVVVRIIYLDRQEKALDLETSPNAEETLANFCKWQETINPADVSNPQHHDIAVLLTRYDICSDNMTNCDLMGLAYVAAACTGNKPCAINEDSGLALGVVVAHEMGHVMGCSHDNEVDSPCKPQTTDGSYHIMSPFVHLHTSVWSTCSRIFITKFLENGMGECLDDEPTETLYRDVKMPAGAVYDADYQCALLFPNLKPKACVTDEQAFCKRLFCRTKPESCTSNGEPPADGTKCGENKWCFNGLCTRIGVRDNSIDGGWGSWGKWSECSRTCGGGIQYQERECNNPTPTRHGRYCLGERKKVKICNPKPCEDTGMTFREQQCREYNNKPVNQKIHKWKTFWKPDDVCSLYCINEKNVFMKLEPRVKDGTLCKPGTHNRCIFGVCRKVGCDMKIDSDVVEDICGVCGGDASECQIIKNTYNRFEKPGYVKVVTIPKGARNILIEEDHPSPNTIAVGQSEKKLYLNGNFAEDNDGVYDIGGTNGIYEHPQEDKETLYIAGPLKTDVNLYVVFYEKKNPGVRYEFALPKAKLKNVLDKVSEHKKEYNWEYVDWSDCNKRCNGGFKVSTATCIENKQGKVSPTFCKKPKPKDNIMSCNNDPCPTKWFIGPWTECDACLYHAGIKRRKVYCVREAEYPGKDDELVGDKHCLKEKPASQTLCCSNKPCKKTSKRSNKFRKKLQNLWSQINKHITKKDLEDNFKTMKMNRNGQIKHSKIHSNFRHNYRISKYSYKDSELDPAIIESLTFPKTQSMNVSSEPNELEGNLKIPEPKSLSLDFVPDDRVQLIEARIVKTHSNIDISDRDLEKMGDKLYDELDICHQNVYLGKEAMRHKKVLEVKNQQNCSKNVMKNKVEEDEDTYDKDEIKCLTEN